MRRAARIDTTAHALVTRARAFGADVLILNSVVDALIWWRGRWYVVDFKSKGGKPTKAQSLLVQRGCRIDFVSTPEQLDALLFSAYADRST